jgi:acetyl esterase/lipase
LPAQRAIAPDLAALLQGMPKTKYGSLDLDDLTGTRALLRQMTAQMTAGLQPDPSVTVHDAVLDRGDGTELVVRFFRPDGAGTAQPALLWFHAGGQIMGRVDEDDLYLTQLAKDLSVVVAGVDYRLAPEHRAPAAAQDGLAAYRHVLEHAGELGIDPDRIALGGASGGGAPALATAYLIRDHRLPAPRAMTLLYPMIDDRNTSDSSRAITDVGVWDRPANLLAWKAVLGDRAGTDDVSPYEAPARATDLSGLPPTFVAAAEFDVLRDEDLALAAGLLRAGVQTEIHHFAGTFHAWDRFAPDSPLAQELNRVWHLFLTRMLANG